MSSTDHFRTFLAITPDEGVLDAVKEKTAELRRTLHQPGIRWESRNKWHVTLRFLGDVPVADLTQLFAAIEGACQGQPAFLGTVAGLGGFPSLKRPRILWAGVQAQGEQLTTLHQSLSSATDTFAAKPDEKRFRPHLTLARLRTEDRRVLTRVEPAVQQTGNLEFGTWEVKYVELWRSTLQSGGSQYELLSRAALHL